MRKPERELRPSVPVARPLFSDGTWMRCENPKGNWDGRLQRTALNFCRAWMRCENPKGNWDTGFGARKWIFLVRVDEMRKPERELRPFFITFYQRLDTVRWTRCENPKGNWDGSSIPLSDKQPSLCGRDAKTRKGIETRVSAIGPQGDAPGGRDAKTRKGIETEK